MGPDDSGQHRLSKTVEALSPESALPPSDGAIVALTRDKAETLIGAIQQLGKANLRLYGEMKDVKRVLFAGAAIGVVMFVALAFGIYQLAEVNAQLHSASTQQAQTTERLAAVVTKLSGVDDAVAEIPRLEEKPAPSGDPTAEPVVVLKQPRPKARTSSASNGSRPPAPPSIEIPVLHPKEKKR